MTQSVGGRSPVGAYSFNKHSNKDLKRFVAQPNIKAQMQTAYGNNFWIDEKNGGAIVEIGGNPHNVVHLEFNVPNQPNKKYFGADLNVVIRMALVAWPAIEKANADQVAKGEKAFKHVVINEKDATMTGYVSTYSFNHAQGKYDYVIRGRGTGTNISEADFNVFEQIKKLKEAQIEKQKAYEHEQNFPGSLDEMRKQQNKGKEKA